MRIIAIETTPIDVPIVASRATVGGRGAHTSSPFLIVEVLTDEGITGLGEVSCTPIWSGEDQVSAAHFIRTLLAPLLIGEDPRDRTRLTRLMQRHLANNPFTRAGVEIALWDIAGKALGVPIHVLMGGAVRDTIHTKYSVSGLAPERAAEIAVWAVEQGFTAMKVKVGLDPVADLARVRAVREAVGPDVLLGVDANGGWTPAAAVKLLPALEDLDIAFVEQPVPAGDPCWLAHVRNASSLPVVADESLSTGADALALIDAGAADMFSVYTGMGGGLSEALSVCAIAAAAQIPATIGSNLELGIGQAAMIHLAIAHPGIRPEIIPCDIISRFFYEADIVQEPLPVEGGIARRIDAPGLGVALDRAAVSRFRSDR